MKVFLVIGLLILIINDATAQGQDSIIFKKYSFQEIHDSYPFDQVKEIKLVSYGVDPSKGDKNSRGDEPKRIPMNGDQVSFEGMDQVTNLTKKEIDSIADILYNTCFRYEMTEYSPAFCFLPRNAIIFVDAKGQTFFFIEVCFECGKMRLSEKQKRLGEGVCDNTLEALESFFIKHGLKTSIKREKK